MGVRFMGTEKSLVVEFFQNEKIKKEKEGNYSSRGKTRDMSRPSRP